MARIRNNEEYEEKRDRLNELVDRYKWLVSSKDPMSDLRGEQEICILRYSDSRITTEEALKIEVALQKIGVQSMYISSRGTDEYESILMDEIQALILDICQYEANKRLSEKTPLEILKAIITGDKLTEKDLRYKRAYGYGEDIGYISRRKVIDLTPPEMILERMAKQIDWAKLELITDEEKIEIKEKRKEEMALVLSDEKSTNKKIKTMQVEVQEKIKNLGLNDINLKNSIDKDYEKDKSVNIYDEHDSERAHVEKKINVKEKDNEVER